MCCFFCVVCYVVRQVAAFTFTDCVTLLTTQHITQIKEILLFLQGYGSWQTIDKMCNPGYE